MRQYNQKISKSIITMFHRFIGLHEHAQCETAKRPHYEYDLRFERNDTLQSFSEHTPLQYKYEYIKNTTQKK